MAVIPSFYHLCVETEELEDRISKTSEDLLTLFDATPAASPLLKVKGDFLRYLAEIQKDTQRITFAEKSLEAYEEASKLNISTAFTLAVRFNEAIIYYKIFKAPDRAKEILEDVVKSASGKVDKNTQDLIHILEKTIKKVHSPDEESSGGSGNGLRNDVGEYNCFLNAIIQSLWHLRQFRDDFLRESALKHSHTGDSCVTCALYEIFGDLTNDPTVPNPPGEKAVSPAPLRTALSELHQGTNVLQKGQMNDASEVLVIILQFLHRSFTPVTKLAKINAMDNEGCACIVHSHFGMDISKSMKCDHCELETGHQRFNSFFHLTNANDLRDMKDNNPKCSFDKLLGLVEMDCPLPCEDGGCGNFKYSRINLSTPPHYFITVIGWKSACESVEDIKTILAALSTVVDLSVLYRGLDQKKNKQRLVSVVCYRGHHYLCFARREKQWMMFDDKTVKVVGSWKDVVSTCEKLHLQPQVLFYEAAQ